MRDVYILGVGAHCWGKFKDKPHLQMIIEASNEALLDAGLRWKDIQGISSAAALFGGGISQCLHGNELAQAVAENGVPIYNVSAACAAGGAAMNVGCLLIASGQCDIVLVVGGEKMPEGFIPRPPCGITDDITDIDYVRRISGIPNPAYWAMECRRRMEDFGTTEETLARVSVQAHRIGALNPRSRYRKMFTIEEVLRSPIVNDPLHLYEICAVSDGAAAVILGSDHVSRRLGKAPTRLAACILGTSQFGDTALRVSNLSAPASGSAPYSSEVTGSVWKAYDVAGIGPEDVDFIEIADNSVWQCLAWPELFGFFEPGESDFAFEAQDMDITGRLPVNPSGGFLSFGEATAAMGVLQVCELTWQLRGQAKERQVNNPRAGLSVVLGAAGHGCATIAQI